MYAHPRRTAVRLLISTTAAVTIPVAAALLVSALSIAANSFSKESVENPSDGMTAINLAVPHRHAP